MNKQPTIHQKINLRTANLIVNYVITKDRRLDNHLPAWMKTKARYNSCYDFPRPIIPTDEVNKYINESSDRVRTYLESNMHRNNYLRVDLIGTPIGLRLKHSLVQSRPVDYTEMERTGAVRFVDVDDVELK